MKSQNDRQHASWVASFLGYPVIKTRRLNLFKNITKKKSSKSKLRFGLFAIKEIMEGEGKKNSFPFSENSFCRMNFKFPAFKRHKGDLQQ